MMNGVANSMNSLNPIRGRSESAGIKDPFTHDVIGRAMETHSALGPGLVEEFYHQELSARLVSAGLDHESKPRRELVYRGFVADTFEADMVFPGHLIAELKALRGAFDAEHFTQILCYLKFHDLTTGMLFDFGKESLIFKRVAFTPAKAGFPAVDLPAFVAGRDLAGTLLRLLREIHSAHGLGYRETTCLGLLRAALQAERIPFNGNPTSPISRWGVAALRCLVVDNACAVSVTALGDEVSAADRAALQTCLRWLDQPWGLAVHFGRRTVDVRFVVRPKASPADSERTQI
jgi:GxxExxY protein